MEERSSAAAQSSLAPLLEIEPDLRLLRGLVAVLQVLAESDDSVEPVALAALGHLGEDALSRMEAVWKEVCGSLDSSA